MRTIWRFRGIFAALLLLPLLPGCVAVLAGSAGAGTIAWVEGRLDAPLDVSLDKAEHAVNRAVTDLQFARVSETKDGLTATLTVRTAEDKKVTIKIVRVGELTSRVQIRVGVFGDKDQSLIILDKIKAAL
jgi:hypothetical protein